MAMLGTLPPRQKANCPSVADAYDSPTRKPPLWLILASWKHILINNNPETPFVAGTYFVETHYD